MPIVLRNAFPGDSVIVLPSSQEISSSKVAAGAVSTRSEGSTIFHSPILARKAGKYII